MEYDIGILIGRWQVPELHDAHVQLIEQVIKKHGKCIVFIGTTSVLGSKENPLDYHSRDLMIRRRFPLCVVTAPLPDFRSDEAWSENLDKQVKAIYPKGTVCLYGGRDSFIKHYSGKFDCEELPPIEHQSGEEIRREIGEFTLDSIHFREGIIHSTQNRYPIMYHCIDAAMLKGETLEDMEIIMGTKYGDGQLRLIGGFSDRHETLEDTVKRETYEEVGLAVEHKVHYVGSYAINDWRYKNCSDKIVSSFFWTKYTSGCIVCNDDLDDAKWYKLQNLFSECLGRKGRKGSRVVDSHQSMIRDLIKYFADKEST